MKLFFQTSFYQFSQKWISHLMIHTIDRLIIATGQASISTEQRYEIRHRKQTFHKVRPIINLTVTTEFVNYSIS